MRVQFDVANETSCRMLMEIIKNTAKANFANKTYEEVVIELAKCCKAFGFTNPIVIKEK